MFLTVLNSSVIVRVHRVWRGSFLACMLSFVSVVRPFLKRLMHMLSTATASAALKRNRKNTYYPSVSVCQLDSLFN